ncbi:hypothetical protein BUALT_Bualt03G0138000 [Buddleja alternifolia]|uniref:Uncharacterized protein n=1 Tax=Buddleja alternifolia TaxID=168488 RepID=A0AAV6Y4D8_9LAMI|nr:hypothetical protein BUALT_Bualt03G0138000 [Buddleja alternifolia]
MQPTSIKLIRAKLMDKLLHRPRQFSMMCVCLLGKRDDNNVTLNVMDTEKGDQQGSEGLGSLLMEFNNIFEEPTSLLPYRNQEHWINLKEGANSVNVRPYRYPEVFEATKKEKTLQFFLSIMNLCLSNIMQLVRPDPILVATKLLTRKKFIDTGKQLNVIAVSWLQFMIHDWVDYIYNQESLVQYISSLW